MKTEDRDALYEDIRVIVWQVANPDPLGCNTTAMRVRRLEAKQPLLAKQVLRILKRLQEIDRAKD